MCCILFKWNKLRPLLQVAKLSVYNLSNKHVFYSGFCCVVCIIRNVLKCCMWRVTLFYFIPSTSGWADALNTMKDVVKGYPHLLWLCEPDSCTTGQSERHHSVSSHAPVLGEFVATGLTLNLSSSSRYSRPSSVYVIYL